MTPGTLCSASGKLTIRRFWEILTDGMLELHHPVLARVGSRLGQQIRLLARTRELERSRLTG
jgi:hypothetical protein